MVHYTIDLQVWSKTGSTKHTSDSCLILFNCLISFSPDFLSVYNEGDDNDLVMVFTLCVMDRSGTSDGRSDV
ncbi:MAG: hypothetical protein J5I59_05935 [Saprospiraceae bacterium]|nr:hypothetical protein [Saprospiraceae bacterium]